MKYAIIMDSSNNFMNDNTICMDNLFPLYLRIEGQNQSYRDGLDIHAQQLYQLMEHGHDFKTSLPSLYDIEETVDKIISLGYDSILLIVISRGLSSTCDTIESICINKGISCKVVDTKSSAEIALTCVKKAQSLLAQGVDIEQVIKELNLIINNSGTFIIPSNLKQLVKSGRISNIAASLAHLLKIVPILHLSNETDGKIEVFEKVRTEKKAWNVVINFLREKGMSFNDRICLAHTLCLEKANQLKSLIEQELGIMNIYFCDLVPVVGVHTGLGCVALQWIKEGLECE